MRTEKEINNKLQKLEKDLKKLSSKYAPSLNDIIQMEFLRNNIAFIKWCLK